MANFSHVKLSIKQMHNSRIVLSILLIFFAVTTGIFALRLKRQIIPDENSYHFPVSKLYATTWSVPADTPETYRFSYLGHRPFLYYWINGRVLNILHVAFPNLSEWRELISLRLLSVLYSLGTVFFSYKLSKEFLDNEWEQVFVVFLFTNTLMFAFISSGVSYDNLVNLCSVAGIYYLIRTIKGEDFYQNSFMCFICMAFGALVKFTILPLALILMLSWIVYIFVNHQKVDYKFSWGYRSIFLTLIFTLLVFGNFTVYGINILKYKGVLPACDQILTQKQCENNPVYARGQKIELSNNSTTIIEVLKGNGPDPIAYFFDHWIPAMGKMIFGVMGHKSFFPSDSLITLYRFALFVSIFSAIRYWKASSYPLNNLCVILAFYLIVLFVTNYRSELRTGFQQLGIQGRYIFPVIGVIYILFTYFLASIPNNTIRQIFFLFVTLIFLTGNPLVFLIKPYTIILPKQTTPAEQPVGEIVDQVVVAQEFVSECEGTINRIELLLATYGRTNTHPVIVRLIDAITGQIITEQEFQAESVVDNSWYSIPIHPISGSFGKTYQLIITSPKSIPGNAITIWSTEDSLFPNVQAQVNGKSIDKDLNVQYQCVQPVFKDWFVK